jgi:hypothetical protein
MSFRPPAAACRICDEFVCPVQNRASDAAKLVTSAKLVTLAVLYWTARVDARRYTELMKRPAAVRHRTVDRARARPAFVVASPDAYAGLERIKQLEAQLAGASVDRSARRMLAAAIRIEAIAYRKSLDTDQAAAMRAREPRLDAGAASPTRTPGKPALARRGTTGRRSRGGDA